MKANLSYDSKNGFPNTPQNRLIHWTEFNCDIYSTEYTGEKVVTEVCDVYLDEKVDLRPYMWENPITVSVYTRFDRILELFRMLHLRHMLVVNPADASLVGIITRQDLFAYMHL